LDDAVDPKDESLPWSTDGSLSSPSSKLLSLFSDGAVPTSLE
jgi:hypothetical protein